MRTKRSALSFASALGRTLITLVVGLVATPLILGFLGDARFGAFRTAVDWIGLLIVFELGIRAALGPMLAKALGRDDEAGVRKTLVVGVRALWRVTLVILGAGALLALACTHLIPVGEEASGDLQLGVILGLAGFLFLPLSVFQFLQEARQRAYVVHLLLLVQGLLITGLSVLFAWLGWGITGQFVALFSGGCFLNLVLTVLALRLYPGLLRSVLSDSADPEAKRDLRRLGVPALVLTVCGRLSLVVDTIVVSLFLGPAIVAPFVITTRLAGMVRGQLESIGHASWASLAELHAQGQLEVFNARVVDLTRIISLLGVAVLIPVAVYNEQFVRLWVGSEFYGGDLLTLLIALNAFLLGQVALWNWCFTGSGLFRELVPTWVIGTIINVGLSLVLIGPLGMAGPVLATVVSLIGVVVWYTPVLMRRHFGTPLLPLAKAVLFPVVVGLPSAFGLHRISRFQGEIGWIELVLSGVAAAGSLLLLSWFLILSKEERSRHTAQIRAAFGRKQSDSSEGSP